MSDFETCPIGNTKRLAELEARPIVLPSVDEVREVLRQHGGRFLTDAAQHVLDLIDGVMGRVGQNMPSGLRKSQDFVLTWVNMTVLAFSGVASIPP